MVAGRSANGVCRRNSAVSSSTATASLITETMARAGAAVLGSRMATKVAATSLAVQGEPSEKRTPLRSLKVHSVKSVLAVHDSARSGSGLMSVVSVVRLL
jgi:hypothetical protein